MIERSCVIFQTVPFDTGRVHWRTRPTQ